MYRRESAKSSGNGRKIDELALLEPNT